MSLCNFYEAVNTLHEDLIKHRDQMIQVHKDVISRMKVAESRDQQMDLVIDLKKRRESKTEKREKEFEQAIKMFTRQDILDVERIKNYISSFKEILVCTFLNLHDSF